MKVYVASSWRNEQHPAVVRRLVEAGHDVYDFRNPPHGRGGFSWAELSERWESWSALEYLDALDHPKAREGFRADMDALEWCDACVIVQPCGVSAAMEFGYAVGSKALTIALVYSMREPDLMLGMADHLCLTVDEVLGHLEAGS